MDRFSFVAGPVEQYIVDNHLDQTDPMQSGATGIVIATTDVIASARLIVQALNEYEGERP